MMFAHASLPHLFGNLLLIAIFAPPVIRTLRWWTLPVVCVAQLGGVAAQSLSDALIADPRPLLGLSAVGYGLIAAYSAIFPLSNPLPFLPVSGRAIALIAMVLSGVLAVAAPAAGVGYAAHLGGMIGVFLLLDFMGEGHARKTVL